MNLAIIGATGNVGRKLLEVLEKKNFSFENIYLIANSKIKIMKFLTLKNTIFLKLKLLFLQQVQQLQKNGHQLLQKIR